MNNKAFGACLQVGGTVGVILPLVLLLFFIFPTVSRSEDAHRVFIYDRGAEPGDKNRVVELLVPSKFLNKSEYDKDLWGLNILTWLPDFTSISDGKNSQYGMSCAGYCNGRIMLQITNELGYTKQGFSSFVSFLEYTTNKWYGHEMPEFGIFVKHITPDGTFSRGIRRSIYARDDKGNVTKELIRDTEYLFHVNESNDDPDLFATCGLSDSFASCQLQFALACAPNIDIIVTILPLALRPTYLKVKEDVSNFVARLVQTPDCQNSPDKEAPSQSLTGRQR